MSDETSRENFVNSFVQCTAAALKIAPDRVRTHSKALADASEFTFVDIYQRLSTQNCNHC